MANPSRALGNEAEDSRGESSSSYSSASSSGSGSSASSFEPPPEAAANAPPPPLLRSSYGDLYSSFRRRGLRRASELNRQSTGPSQNGKTKRKLPRSLVGRWTHRQVVRTHHLVSSRCPLLLNRACNAALFAALLFWWITVLATYGDESSPSPSPSILSSFFYSTNTENATPTTKRRTLRKPVPKHESLLGSALHALTGTTKKKRKKEGDLPGCVRPDWHKASYPTCNDVHPIDLSEMILRGIRQTPSRVGYVSSGLWRSVFAVTATDEREISVLKMMKAKHDLTQRNFDRHRRDAVVMERLGGSPHVVDIFGFCGNTVLTEFASQTVDSVIYADTDGREHEETALHTRQTPEGRLKLAIGVMKGLAALHEIDGGPIVHADITAKQYLISEAGAVKVNDFNRCRFMAHREKDNAPCKFVIPTAPGKNRSPEEYKEHDLNEKIDVYSAGNILYGVLTGTKVWYQSGSTEAKNYVMKGVIPFIPNELREPGTTDAALANLTELAFENDPDKRMTAGQMVRELERVQQEYFPTVP